LAATFRRTNTHDITPTTSHRYNERNENGVSCTSKVSISPPLQDEVHLLLAEFYGQNKTKGLHKETQQNKTNKNENPNNNNKKHNNKTNPQAKQPSTQKQQ
jgi:hypothetical protein